MNEQNTNLSNVQAALDAGRALGSPIQPLERTDIVVIPKDYRVEDVEKYIEKHLANPRRIKGNVLLADADSFIRYVNEFKSAPLTHIFAIVPEGNRTPSFLAVLNYHDSNASPTAVAENIRPQWCDHRATYAPQFSHEWQRWMAKNKVKMTQTELAELIEENQLIIADPPGAELLELVQNLDGKNNISCKSLVRLNNGKQKLTYEEDVTLKGQVSTEQGEIEFPSFLKVGIAPFDGGPAYPMICRLRYRIESRRLTFWFESVDVHLVIKTCVDNVVELIKEKTGIEPLMGSPS